MGRGKGKEEGGKGEEVPTRDFGIRVEQKGFPDELEFVVRVDGLVRGDGGVEGGFADEAPGADGVAVHVDGEFGHDARGFDVFFLTSLGCGRVVMWMLC